MTRKTTVRPPSPERRQCEASTARDDAGEYVFTEVTDHDDEEPVSYSVRVDPTKGRQTAVKRRVSPHRESAETTEHRSSGPLSTVTHETSLQEATLDSLVEAWYRHDRLPSDPEHPPTAEADEAGGGDSGRHRHPFDAVSSRHR